MQVVQTHFAKVLEDWFLALVVLVATILLATASKTLLKRLHRDTSWSILREIAPSVSNIVYVLGLKIFSEVAPLTGRPELWMEGGIYVFSVIIYLTLIQKAALISIEWSASRSEQSSVLRQGFIPLMRNTTTLFVFFTGGIMILQRFGYEVRSLITALGVSSLAVGLAAKDTLSNMISGFILIIDRNLHPGDRINLNGVIGDVEEIGLRSTQLKVTDGNTLIVPNSELVNTKLINLSLPNRQGTTNLQFRVSYSESFARIKTICNEIFRTSPYVVQEKPLTVLINSLAEGQQLISVIFWVSDVSQAGSAVSDFNEKLLKRFQEEKIVLLSPQFILNSN